MYGYCKSENCREIVWCRKGHQQDDNENKVVWFLDNDKSTIYNVVKQAIRQFVFSNFLLFHSA